MYGVHQLPGAHAVFAPRRDENHVHSYYGNSHESLRIMFEKDWAHILQVNGFILYIIMVNKVRLLWFTNEGLGPHCSGRVSVAAAPITNIGYLFPSSFSSR